MKVGIPYKAVKWISESVLDRWRRRHKTLIIFGRVWRANGRSKLEFLASFSGNNYKIRSRSVSTRMRVQLCFRDVLHAVPRGSFIGEDNRAR